MLVFKMRQKSVEEIGVGERLDKDEVNLAIELTTVLRLIPKRLGTLRNYTKNPERSSSKRSWLILMETDEGRELNQL